MSVSVHLPSGRFTGIGSRKEFTFRADTDSCKQVKLKRTGPAAAGSVPNKSRRPNELVDDNLTSLAIPVEILNSKLLMVIDTGASCSILDRCTYERLAKGDLLPPIQPCADKFHAVNGSALPVYGRVMIDFKLGEVSYKHSFVITDMPAFHGLLGLDFLGQSIVDVLNGLLWLVKDGGLVSFDCLHIKDNGVRLVCTKQQTIIFLGREIMIPVNSISKPVFKYDTEDLNIMTDLMVKEPFPALTQHFGCLAAAVVAKSEGKTFLSLV